MKYTISVSSTHDEVCAYVATSWENKNLLYIYSY